MDLAWGYDILMLVELIVELLVPEKEIVDLVALRQSLRKISYLG